MLVVCCVGSGLCDELITRSEKSYRLLCVTLCDLETSTVSQHRPELGCWATGGGLFLLNVSLCKRPQGVIFQKTIICLGFTI